MTWIPLGPTLVAAPRVWGYSRLARANELGAQAAVLGIAVHPADEKNIVVVTRRVGGSSAFHTLDDGRSWTAIADDLTRTNPQLDLACAALHPMLPDVVYVGGRAGRMVAVSTDGGRTWPQQRDPGGEVTRLVVDRSSGPDWHTAILYAATDTGVAASTDGGDTWTMAPIGEVTSLAVHMPSTGGRVFYAGVYGKGLFYATSASGPWQNLFGSATGLPPVPAPGTNMLVLVDYSPRQPERVYVMVVPLGNDHQGPYNQQVYVSAAAAPAGAWVARGPVGQPALDYYLEGIGFLVAPEPNGADTADVLLCTGGIWPWRSTDGGRTWDGADWAGSHPSDLHHADMRSFDHYPPKTAYYTDVLSLSATAPRARLYLGSDGGLAASRGYTDPAFDLDAPPGPSIDYNSGPTYDAGLNIVESLNHGLASVALHQYAGSLDALLGGPLSAIGYLSALDTGSARRIGSVAWQFTSGGDVGLIFAHAQPDGVRVWGNLGAANATPSWQLMTWLDEGPAGSPVSVTTPDAPACGATSNMVSDGSGGFYAGILALEQVTTLQSPVGPGSHVDVYPVTMTPDLVVGARVCVGTPDGSVYQPISAVAADHFTVTLLGSATHLAGSPVQVVRCYAAHVSETAAGRISQVFIPQDRRFYRLARSGDVLLAASADQRLWTISSASSAGPGSVWSEVAGRPADFAGSTLIDPSNPNQIVQGEFVSGIELQRPVPLIASLATDAAGTFYVMLGSPVSVSLGGTPIDTPLFSVSGGAWVPENCPMPSAAAIPNGVALGTLIADPSVAGRLYVSRNARLYQLDKGSSGWTWTDLTENLPGQEIHDLWVGNIAAEGAPPRTVIRAATAVRGVWELEPAGEAVEGARPYFRDHAFDPGWLGPSVDGVASPFDPTQRFYHWQSADIKVDTPLRDSTGALYYQNDPEAPTPAASDFAWIKDRSQSASAGVTARIWVRVNNRSTEPSGTLHVWGLTCPYSGALPLLPAEFWSRFHVDGSLDSSAPGGAWTSLGVQDVSLIQAEAPGVVGFTMPTGAEGDHRCIVVFVHGPAGILETNGLSLVVDEVVPASRQIAQRNVFVTAPLPSSPGTPPPVSDGGWPGGIDALRAQPYVEFNNPGGEARQVTLRFDARNLSGGLSLQLRLSRNLIPASIHGARELPVLVSYMDWLLEAIRRLWNIVLLFLGLRRRGLPLKRLPLSWRLYRAPGGGQIELDNIHMLPGGRVAAQLRFKQAGKLKPGAEYHLDILQLVGKRLVGGASVFLPVAGDPRPKGELDLTE